MNESTSYSELLCAFLDNELDGVETSTLFYSLAQNQELQQELRQLISVRSALHGSLLEPPAYLASRVMAATGLVPPAAAVTAAVTGFWLRLFRGRAFVAIVSAIATAGVMLLLLKPSDASVRPQGLAATLPNDQPAVQQSDRPAVPPRLDAGLAAASANGLDRPGTGIGQSAGAAYQANGNRAHDRARARGSVAATAWGDSRAYAPRRRQAANRVTERQDIRDMRAAIGESHSPNDAGSLDGAARAAQRADTLPAVLMPMIDRARLRSVRVLPAEGLDTGSRWSAPDGMPEHSPDALAEAEPIGHLQFYLRGVAALRSYPSPDIAPLATPPINNIAAGVFYVPDGENAIGLEVGQEHVLQQYEGMSEQGLRMRVEQNYLALWAGAAYQRTFGAVPLLAGAHPFARLMAGGMATGPMARVLLGFRFQVGRVGALLGAEGSLLGYRYQGSWFSTSKVGATYGMSIDF